MNLRHGGIEHQAKPLDRLDPRAIQSCLPNGGLVSLVEAASLQWADANRAVWP
jgi:hypothetical protein